MRESWERQKKSKKDKLKERLKREQTERQKSNLKERQKSKQTERTVFIASVLSDN